MKRNELLLTYLKRIGFDLKPCGCEYYLIQDHNGIDTEYMFWDTTITHKSGNTVAEFEIKEDNMKCDGNALFIGNDRNFVMFVNHDM